MDAHTITPVRDERFSPLRERAAPGRRPHRVLCRELAAMFIYLNRAGVQRPPPPERSPGGFNVPARLPFTWASVIAAVVRVADAVESGG